MQSSISDLSIQQREQLDRLAYQFEHELRTGARPVLEQYLVRLPGLQEHALRELMAIEIEICRERGETPDPAEYCNRFPNDEKLIYTLLEVEPSETVDQEASSISVASTQSSLLPAEDTDSLSSVAPAPYARQHSAQAANVDRLLGKIAAQSHFEDRYDVRGTLASGGMGTVFRAYDQILQREVAVKMMRDSDGSFDPAIRGQFLKEARVGGRLLHPHVLSVFDLGVNRSKQIYYTMRLVDGASLQHCLDSVDKVVVTKLISYPLRKIVEAFCGACEGVDFAHQNGVIHLDLKPQNILMSGFNEVFVIDWGLSRVDEVDDTEALLDIYRDSSTEHNTASNTGVFGGRVVGTPGYMSPEQAQGLLPSFNHATDVFGLGGILYFVLYGTTPNRGRTSDEMISTTSQRKERGNLRVGILPKGRRVKKEARDAVDALEIICIKALEPKQDDRYADVEELIIELNEWLAETADSPLSA